MTSRRRSKLALPRTIAALVLLGPIGACEADTGGRLVRVALVVSTTRATGTTTNSGWNVSFEEACVALGPIYVYEGGGILAHRDRSVFPTWLVRSAYAHPGDQHFDGGEVKGEWLEQRRFDAVHETTTFLGTVLGSAGPVRSLSLVLAVPRAVLGADPCLRGHQAYVVGVAERGDQRVPFEGGIDIENVGSQRRVDGIGLVGGLEEGTTIEITVDARAWFSHADFAQLETIDERGRFVIEARSQPYNAWYLGLRGVGGYAARIR